MTKFDKKLHHLKSRPTPKDFKWTDLETIFKALGFEKIEGDGSRVKFFHEEKGVTANFHKPHPRPYLKAYAVRQALAFLIENGYIDND